MKHQEKFCVRPCQLQGGSMAKTLVIVSDQCQLDGLWGLNLWITTTSYMVKNEKLTAQRSEGQGVKAGGPTCLLRYYGKFSQEINLRNKEFVALIIHKYIWKSTGLVHYLIIVKLFEKIILWKTFIKWKNCWLHLFSSSITLFERAWLLVYASTY